MLSDIKSIFAGTTTDFGSEEKTSAIPYALSLAILMDAHLTVESTSVKINLATPWARNYAQRFTNENNNRLRKAAKAIAEETKKRAQSEQIDCEIRSDHLNYGAVLDAFALQARTHDLSIIDTERETMHFDRGIIEFLLIESGRPIIIVPENCDRFKGDSIIIAWDGSGKAARAVGDAIPLLRKAKKVTIFAVKEEKKGELIRSADQLLSHLERHAVNVSVNIENAEGRNIAAVIQEAAKDVEMLVMGAYVHSRLREYIFGGVTQSLLRDHQIPIFMSY
jgi:nucleotide-binding universal stress UspA family protein